MIWLQTRLAGWLGSSAARKLRHPRQRDRAGTRTATGHAPYAEHLERHPLVVQLGDRCVPGDLGLAPTRVDSFGACNADFVRTTLRATGRRDLSGSSG